MDVRAPSEPLAQPSRARLFSLLCELGRPAGTIELAEALGLHRNGVRLHLEQLERAGLVDRRRVRQAVGRPSDRWSVSPSALPHGDPPTAYADLGRWLVRAMTSSKVALRDIESTGQAIGAELVRGGEGRDAEARLHQTLVVLGFQPSREPGDPGRMAYRLHNCPYREVAEERQAVVCTLHRGMTRGLVQTLDPKTKVTGFHIEEPATAGCRIELRGPMAAAADPAGGA